MKYRELDQFLFNKNRKKLLGRIKKSSLVIVNSNDEMPRNGDQHFLYRQNSDMFYLTGLDQEKCILILCPAHPVEALREIVFITRPDENMTTWYGHKYSKDEAVKVSGVKTVKWLSDFESTLRDLMVHSEHVYLNLNEQIKFITEVPYYDLRFAHKIINRYPLHEYKRLAPLLTELRMEKEPEEIRQIIKACEITEKAFRRVLSFVRPGVMEYEIEAEIIHEFIRNGAQGHAYDPIVASGKNACVLHYIKNDARCKDGDLLLLDFGAEYANYAADCSRTIPVNGKFTRRQLDCYNAVLRVMKKATRLLVPGTTIDEVYKKVCALMEKEMVGLKLFSKKGAVDPDTKSPLYMKYFMHGVSHFVGLDVHDAGTKYMKLKKGMVLSCEPGIYIPKENIGIRLENIVLVDETPVDLMAGIPIEAEEIMKLMRRGKS